MDANPKDWNEIVADYADGPSRLEAAIAGFSESELALATDAESWSVRMIVHHVADGDDIWKTSIKQAIGNAGSEFTLQWYWQIPQVDWATCWGYRERAIAPSLAMFRSNRAHVKQLLDYAPGAMEQGLKIRWPKGEEQDVSVEWIVEMQTRHVEQHVADIGGIREKHGI